MRRGLQRKTTWIHILIPLIPSFVTLSKSFMCLCFFPLKKNGSGISTQPVKIITYLNWVIDTCKPIFVIASTITSLCISCLMSLLLCLSNFIETLNLFFLFEEVYKHLSAHYLQSPELGKGWKKKSSCPLAVEKSYRHITFWFYIWF